MGTESRNPCYKYMHPAIQVRNWHYKIDKGEIADVKIRKFLQCMEISIPYPIPKNNTSWKKDGWGLMCAKATILKETRSIQKYIRKMMSKDRIFKISERTFEDD